MPVDIQEPVQGAIWHCLNHHCYTGAMFLAERLEAEVHSEESLYLLATSYYRSGRRNQAMQVLKCKGIRSPKCRYLLALCCFELNNLQAAEHYLVGDDVLKPRTLDEISVDMGDSASFALELLGQIYMQSERRAKAIEAFNKALSLNPFLWPAFEFLCNMGEKPDVSKVFQVSGLENFTHCNGSSLFGPGVASSTPQASETRTESMRSYDLPASAVNTPVQPITTADVGVTNISTPLASIAPPHPITSYVTPEDQGIPVNPVSTMAPNRLRSAPPKLKSFSTTHSMSPFSPSFGILPLESSSFTEVSQGSFTSLCMGPAPLNETNDTFLMPKRLGNRKEPGTTAGVPTRMGVFCQSGNTATTPSYSSTPAPSVRRSTRLYSSNNSVKENNKSGVTSGQKTTRFAAPRQNVKRTRTRAETSDFIGGPINEFQELNLKDENRERDGEKLERVLVSTPTAQASFSADLSIAHKATLLQKQAADGLMTLLRSIGEAYISLSQYDCRKALEIFEDLPLNQKNTGWVLSRMGRAHFELGEFKEAKKLFGEVHKSEPYRTDSMEYYSAALWQLEDAVSLSALSLHLQELNTMDVATWCCTGTALALSREHDAAIKCFQRAIKLNPKYPWAYTLLGHEYMTIEEMEKAVTCFNNAIRIDKRHYNGWYGVGLVYQKQEQHLRALHYFRNALAINKHHPILKCHLALVQHALQRTEIALQILDGVSEEQPRNALCKFQRASIYFAKDRYADALRELEELKKIVPDEAAVFYLMGNVYKKMNDTHSALMHFSRATDLDPKGASHFMKEKPDATLSLSINKLPSHEGHDTQDVTEGEGLNQSNESNNLSSESLEFRVQPAMDSDDDEQD